MEKSKGFTIIELIVVIAIIAILASIVLVNVTSYINKAKDAKIKSDIANIALAMGSCLADTGTYVGCIGTDKVPQTLIDDINATGTGGTFVTSATPTASAYCMGSSLPGGGNVCADATGVTTATACTTLITKCP